MGDRSGDRSGERTGGRREQITALDLQNPLFIHPSDNSGMIVSTIKLTGEKYRRWKKSMIKALSVKNKLWLVEGVDLRNDENGLQWSRCNDMICSWILNTVSSEIYNTLDEYDTAREMWNDLEESYGQKNAPLIFQIKKDIQNCDQKNSNLTEFFTKMKGLWQQLSAVTTPLVCKCGKCECNLQKLIEDADKEDKLMRFLMGLNDNFDNARRQILMSTPLPFAGTAYSLLMQGDMGTKASTSHSEITEMMAKQKAGSSSSNVDDRSTDTRRKERCAHCGGNHKFERCWELIGYPSWHSKSKDKPQAPRSDDQQKHDRKKGEVRAPSKANSAGKDSVQEFLLSQSSGKGQLSAAHHKLVANFINFLEQSNSPGHESHLAGPSKEEDDCSW